MRATASPGRPPGVSPCSPMSLAVSRRDGITLAGPFRPVQPRLAGTMLQGSGNYRGRYTAQAANGPSRRPTRGGRWRGRPAGPGRRDALLGPTRYGLTAWHRKEPPALSPTSLTIHLIVAVEILI